MLYHRIRYEEFQVIKTLTDCAQPCEYNEYRLVIIVISIIITSIIIMTSTGVTAGGSVKFLPAV